MQKFLFYIILFKAKILYISSSTINTFEQLHSFLIRIIEVSDPIYYFSNFSFKLKS